MNVEAIEIRYDPNPPPVNAAFQDPHVKATVIIDGTRYGGLVPVILTERGDPIHRALQLAVETVRKTIERHAERAGVAP